MVLWRKIKFWPKVSTPNMELAYYARTQVRIYPLNQRRDWHIILGRHVPGWCVFLLPSVLVGQGPCHTHIKYFQCHPVEYVFWYWFSSRNTLVESHYVKGVEFRLQVNYHFYHDLEKGINVSKQVYDLHPGYLGQKCHVNRKRFLSLRWSRLYVKSN